METIKLSLIGDREDNQDRVDIATADDVSILIVVDGMGGHAEGELAADTAVDAMIGEFNQESFPCDDIGEFLSRCIVRAHEAVVAIGKSMDSDDRPRATCALCLIQNDSAFWAHVGDSRIYHLRDDRVLTRTRDHSHVEMLLQDGMITEEEIAEHPLKNFVECCLGGESELPGASMVSPAKLVHGDIIVVCSDGLWGGVSDDEIAAFYDPDEGSLGACLEALAFASLEVCAPWADNTTAAVFRFQETDESN
jgi:serine/threonine protein phosphatase PrpC